MLGLSEPPEFPVLEPVYGKLVLGAGSVGVSAGRLVGGLADGVGGLAVDIDTLIGLGCVLLRLVGDVRVGIHIAVELVEDAGARIAL